MVGFGEADELQELHTQIASLKAERDEWKLAATEREEILKRVETGLATLQAEWGTLRETANEVAAQLMALPGVKEDSQHYAWAQMLLGKEVTAWGRPPVVEQLAQERKRREEAERNLEKLPERTEAVAQMAARQLTRLGVLRRGVLEVVGKVDGELYLAEMFKDERSKAMRAWLEGISKELRDLAGDGKGEGSPERPPIVTLCGSSRFVAEMAVLAWGLEKDGNIVHTLHLLPDSYTKQADHQAEFEGVAAQMDELHLRKIDRSDKILVVNIGGYIGDSTQREIEYARKMGKTVKFLEADSIEESRGRGQGEGK